LCCEHVSVVVVFPLVLPLTNLEEVRVVQQVQQVHRWVGRGIGLDLHRDFCEVGICQDGVDRSAGRVAMTPEALEVLAASLESTDRVAMEVSGGSWEVARLLEPHVNRVVVVSPDDTGIAHARTKTDKLDARTLAKLMWQGDLDAVWMPDERCRVLRRRLARREQLVRSRSRVKNEVHAVLMRRLKPKPPCSDLFGVKGRKWLRSLELPVEEMETVQSALRQISFLDREIEEIERMVAKQIMSWPEAKRLMTVPGVNLIVAATFMAAIGEINRFFGPKRLVAYLGLDPRIRQSGEQVARSGRISKRGSASTRWALVEAAWTVVQQPGPLRAFYLRIRARRGHGKAIVAVARKLAVLFWCMLQRGEEYAHQQPSLTAQKMRRLEIAAGAPVRKGKPSGVWETHKRMRHAEKQLAAQAQTSYERTVRDWQASAPNQKEGASVTPERA
jgi:transposase